MKHLLVYGDAKAETVLMEKLNKPCTCARAQIEQQAPLTNSTTSPPEVTSA